MAPAGVGAAARPTLAAVLDFYHVAYRADTAGWTSALCCFHDESVASLRINVDDQAFMCQACSAKGHDSIAFIMAKEHCDFLAALRIADGIPGERTGPEPAPKSIAGRPAPVPAGHTYRPKYQRRRRRG